MRIIAGEQFIAGLAIHQCNRQTLQVRAVIGDRRHVRNENLNAAGRDHARLMPGAGRAGIEINDRRVVRTVSTSIVARPGDGLPPHHVDCSKIGTAVPPNAASGVKLDRRRSAA